MQKGSSPDICCYLVPTYIMLLIAEPSLFSLLSTRVRIILFLWFMASCHLQHKVHSKENKTTTRLPSSSMWRAGVVSSPFCFFFSPSFFLWNLGEVSGDHAPNRTRGGRTWLVSHLTIVWSSALFLAIARKRCGRRKFKEEAWHDPCLVPFLLQAICGLWTSQSRGCLQTSVF